MCGREKTARRGGKGKVHRRAGRGGEGLGTEMETETEGEHLERVQVGNRL